MIYLNEAVYKEAVQLYPASMDIIKASWSQMLVIAEQYDRGQWAWLSLPRSSPILVTLLLSP